MPDEEKLPQIASLIPEIYYELIARIPAGMLLVLFTVDVWLTCSKSPIRTHINIDDSFTTLIVVLGAAWAVGIVLSPVAYPIRKCFRKSIWEQLLKDRQNLELVKRFGKRLGIRLEDPPPKDGWPEVIDRRLQDYVQYELEHARMILPKMEAEGILAAHLAVALFILPILHLVLLMLFHQQLNGYYWWYLLLLAPIGGAYRVSRHYTEGLALRLLSFLYVIDDLRQVPKAGRRPGLPPPSL